jgi:hypothetical protein
VPPIAVFVVILDDRHRIDAGEPAVQVDIGAAFGTKRAKSLDLRLTADGARSRLIDRGHGTNVRPRDRRGERKPARSLPVSRSFHSTARPSHRSASPLRPGPRSCPPVLPPVSPPKASPPKACDWVMVGISAQRVTGGRGDLDRDESRDCGPDFGFYLLMELGLRLGGPVKESSIKSRLPPPILYPSRPC